MIWAVLAWVRRNLFNQPPDRGTARDDIRPGLRTVGFRRRVIIAFAVLDQAVVVIGVFYGGRDYEAVLNDPDAASE